MCGCWSTLVFPPSRNTSICLLNHGFVGQPPNFAGESQSSTPKPPKCLFSSTFRIRNLVCHKINIMSRFNDHFSWSNMLIEDDLPIFLVLKYCKIYFLGAQIHVFPRFEVQFSTPPGVLKRNDLTRSWRTSRCAGTSPAACRSSPRSASWPSRLAQSQKLCFLTSRNVAYNPIPLILNTPQMIPMMWNFPTKPWFQRGCLVLGGWDYIVNDG